MKQPKSLPAKMKPENQKEIQLAYNRALAHEIATRKQSKDGDFPLVDAARARTKTRIRMRNELNALYGRMRGGVAR